jgi:hypothetical protein
VSVDDAPESFTKSLGEDMMGLVVFAYSNVENPVT